LRLRFPPILGRPGISASLDGLKRLVGDWTATDADGKPFSASFRLISNNTALAETVNSQQDSQMVSIYNADGPRVAMTHFCSIGNQPRLETPSERPNPNEFVFSFIGATNLASPNDQHMHRMVITLEAQNTSLRCGRFALTAKTPFGNSTTRGRSDGGKPRKCSCPRS